MRLLLDTTVLIDALRSRKNRRQLLAELVRVGHTLSISALNVAEIYAGVRAGEESVTESFLSAFDCFDINAQTGRMAGELRNKWARKGRTLALADTVIAAAAIENHCV
ncbi:MAG TPA: PIN domain-containing protein, partial [Terriglobales bacterium]|nr:PIN domain-containing protein [Terriglobales bacterium]